MSGEKHKWRRENQVNRNKWNGARKLQKQQQGKSNADLKKQNPMYTKYISQKKSKKLKQRI